MDDLSDLGMSDDALPELGGQHSLHGGLDLLDALVDDPVCADLDVLPLGRFGRASVGPDVEAYDYRVRGGGEHDVALGDAAGCGVDDVHLDLVVREFFERLLHCLG